MKSLYIPEHCPFLLQTKQFNVIIHTFSPSLLAPTPTHQSFHLQSSTLLHANIHSSTSYESPYLHMAVYEIWCMIGKWKTWKIYLFIFYAYSAWFCNAIRCFIFLWSRSLWKKSCCLNLISRIHKQIMDIGGTKLKAVESRLALINSQVDQLTGLLTKANVAIKTAERLAFRIHFVGFQCLMCSINYEFPCNLY